MGGVVSEGNDLGQEKTRLDASRDLANKNISYPPNNVRHRVRVASS